MDNNKVMEEWKETKYKGYYVSNTGLVKGPKGLLKLNSKHKYVPVSIYQNGNRITTYAHRLVAEAFISNPENKLEINHINGIKKDNRVENLQWSTRSENMKHAYDNGLNTPPCLFGKDNPSYKHGKGCGNYRGDRKNRL
jgi:hypothetical protein